MELQRGSMAAMCYQIPTGAPNHFTTQFEAPRVLNRKSAALFPTSASFVVQVYTEQ